MAVRYESPNQRYSLLMPSYSKKRGKARNTAQLGKLQKDILKWLKYHQTADVRSEYSSIVKQHGVLWSSKHFYGKNVTKSQCVALSKALTGLERRKLVTCYRPGKKRTQRVLITPLGRKSISKSFIAREYERRVQRTQKRQRY